MMRCIDLNCDLGEGAGHDAELMPLITSANIACGAHAGDEATMRATVKLARAHGVAVGAHPGFPDREHFGRREIAAPADEVRVWVRQQVNTLADIACECGVRVGHVKPHGALYNLAARDDGVAEAIAEAVAEIDRHFVLVGLAGSCLIDAGKRCRLQVAHEVFADRGYAADGSLLSRSLPGALLTDSVQVMQQVLNLVQQGEVITVEGTSVPLQVDTICLHGDGAHAVEFARTVRAAVLQAGMKLNALAGRRGTR